MLEQVPLEHDPYPNCKRAIACCSSPGFEKLFDEWRTRCSTPEYAIRIITAAATILEKSFGTKSGIIDELNSEEFKRFVTAKLGAL